MKVFGIGWAKTGTTSLGEAFEALGLSHVGPRLDLVEDLMRGDMARIRAVVQAHQSFEDWPWAALWREMRADWPDAKFILTVRDPEAVERSWRGMVDRQARRNRNIDAIRRFLYGFDPELAPPGAIANRVRRHEAEVRAAFRDAPGKLLVVDWSRGDGWPELCNFLSAPIPERPFPHANSAVSESRLLTGLKRLVVRGRRRILSGAGPEG